MCWEISVRITSVSCGVSWKTIFSSAPVDFRRKPEPVTRTRVPSNIIDDNDNSNNNNNNDNSTSNSSNNNNNNDT